MQETLHSDVCNVIVYGVSCNVIVYGVSSIFGMSILVNVAAKQRTGRQTQTNMAAEMSFKQTFYNEINSLRHCTHRVSKNTGIDAPIRSLKVTNFNRLLVQCNGDPFGVDQWNAIFGPYNLWFRCTLSSAVELDCGP